MKDTTHLVKGAAKDSSVKPDNHKKTHRMAALVVILVLVGFYVIVIYNHSPNLVNASDIYTQASTPSALVLNWPTNTEATLGVNGYGVLASYGAQSQTPTASIAKVMTALAVLSKYPLALGQSGPTITISSGDVGYYQNYLAEDGSVVKVAAGEQISEYQALQAMLLPSADNMADTLAVWAFGSTSNYTTYANQLATKIGMSHSTFSDASGFSPRTISTPADLFLMGEAAMNNQVIAQIVGQPSASLPIAGLVKNVDWVLGEDGIIGIKTGNTDQAGGCFLFAAKVSLANSQSITLIGVILKAPTLQGALDDSIPLLKSAEQQVQLKTLLAANTELATYKVSWGSSVQAANQMAMTAPILPGMSTNLTITTKPIKVPAVAGTQVGTVNITYGNQKVSSPIVLSQPVSAPSLVWKLLHPFKNI